MTLNQRFDLGEVTGADARSRQREAFGRDLGQCDFVALREPVTERGYQHQWFRPSSHLKQTSTFPTFEGESKVRAAIADQSCGLLVREFAHVDCNRRPVMLQFEQQACERLACQVFS